ncbi:MAG: beta-ketoacyl synthase chain length factor [Edaphocola sp.]
MDINAGAAWLKLRQKIYFWHLPTEMYLLNFCAISPAGVITAATKLASLQKTTQQIATAQEPDYKNLIPPMQLRRMTKPVRTGIAAARMTLEPLGREQPASIHVGTAWGMLQDSEHFLQKMIEQQEQMLAPTAFIQSTHNTVAGQIALGIACTAHNMTFVHTGHSLENAYLDALLMPPHEAPMLLGCVDEITESITKILGRFGIYNQDTIPGEGAAFYAVSHQYHANACGKISFCDTFNAADSNTAKHQINRILKENNIVANEGDVLLEGTYINLAAMANMPIVRYKDYCGHYPTAAGFGWAMALLHLQEGYQRCFVTNRVADNFSFTCIEKVVHE